MKPYGIMTSLFPNIEGYSVEHCLLAMIIFFQLRFVEMYINF